MTQQFHFWYISEETQNTNIKKYMQYYVLYSIIYNKFEPSAGNRVSVH